jgi:LysM repeat protein
MTRVSGPQGPAMPGPEMSGPDLPTTTVQTGEKSLHHVARRLKLAPEHLAAANPHIAPSAELKIGQEIRLPSPTHLAHPAAEAATEHSTGGPLSAKGDLHLQAGMIKEALHHAGSLLDPQNRPVDPSDRLRVPPDLGGSAPLDIDLNPARQPRVMPMPPPPPPDDLQAREQLGMPARTGVNRDPEEPEEVVKAYPTPDGGGGYGGPPSSSTPQHGIGLHSQPVASPIHFTPGEPRPPEDNIPDPGQINIHREQPPRPNVGPSFDLGTAMMDAPSRPRVPHPNEGGVGGQNDPPSPPPPKNDEIIG